MARLSAIVLCSLGFACSGVGHTDSSPPTVVYDGAPTDEALQHMNSLPAQSGAELTILSPADGDSIERHAPPTIVFAEGTLAAFVPLPPNTFRPLPRWVRALDHVLGVRDANAHGTPYNGIAYLLSISDATGKPRLQIFTDQASVTVSEADWSDLADFPSPFRLTVLSATFEENLVTAGGGPFQRAHVSFTIH